MNEKNMKDEKDYSQSSDQTSQVAHTTSNGPEKTHEELTRERETNKRNRTVRLVRVVCYTVFAIAALSVSIGMYFFGEHSEESTFLLEVNTNSCCNKPVHATSSNPLT